MKRLLILSALVGAMLLPAPVLGYTTIPGLSAELSIVSNDGVTVVLQVTQTGGEPVQINVDHFCYAGDVFAGAEYKSVFSSGQLTFNIASRRYKGQDLVPTRCWASPYYKLSGNLQQPVGDDLVTLGSP